MSIRAGIELAERREILTPDSRQIRTPSQQGRGVGRNENLTNCRLSRNYEMSICSPKASTSHLWIKGRFGSDGNYEKLQPNDDKKISVAQISLDQLASTRDCIFYLAPDPLFLQI